MNKRTRSTLDYYECFYVEESTKTLSRQLYQYQQKISEESLNLKLSYILIEDMLIDAFKYILPVEENKHCSSMMFSSIIRESSNIYEIVSKTILKKMYENVTKPNIHDFVFLSKKLKLNSVKIESSLLNPLSKSEKNLLKPFQKIESGEIEKPEWWNAYNKIKHSPNSTKEHATLLNAISSLAAANIIITKYLGPGVVLGTLFKPKEQDGKLLFEIINIQTSKLFTTSTNSFSFDL